MSAPLLEISDLRVEFPSLEGVVRAVRGVDLTVAPGEVVALVGESGSGKTLTALSVMGLLPRGAEVSGRVRFEGDDLLAMPARSRMGLRGSRMAMVFQEPQACLDPVLRVGTQIAEAVQAHAPLGRRAARARSAELLEKVGLPGAVAAAYPHELSGGMQQRAVVAMAVAHDPVLLIADEPTASLDVTVQAEILDLLAGLQRASGAGLLLITHDLGVVAAVADSVAVAYAGRIVERGAVGDVFVRPAMPYTVGLLAAARSLSAARKPAPIPGSPPSPRGPFTGCPFAPRCGLAEAACLLAEPAMRPVGDGHQSACRRPGDVGAFAEEALGAVSPEPWRGP